MKQLVLIRHGESDWNLENRFTGWADVDLTPKGRDQAVTAGESLKKGVANLEKILIDRDPAQRELMMTRTGRRTVPQIYIGETHVGGYDDLVALESRLPPKMVLLKY